MVKTLLFLFARSLTSFGPKTHWFYGEGLVFLVFTYFWTEKGWHHVIPPRVPPSLATPLHLPSPTCLGQKTVISFGLRVKLPPAQLPICLLSHTVEASLKFTLFLLLLKSSRETMNWIPTSVVLGLTWPGIEPKTTVPVADALSTPSPTV